MPPRIAIPMPHSIDREYAERAIPQYEGAIEQAGGEPVRIPLDRTSDEVRTIAESCETRRSTGTPESGSPTLCGDWLAIVIADSCISLNQLVGYYFGCELTGQFASVSAHLRADLAIGNQSC